MFQVRRLLATLLARVKATNEWKVWFDFGWQKKYRKATASVLAVGAMLILISVEGFVRYFSFPETLAGCEISRTGRLASIVAGPHGTEDLLVVTASGDSVMYRGRYWGIRERVESRLGDVAQVWSTSSFELPVQPRGEFVCQLQVGSDVIIDFANLRKNHDLHKVAALAPSGISALFGLAMVIALRYRYRQLMRK